MSYKLSIIREFDQFEKIARDWDDLIRAKWNDYPFMRHFWYSNYFRAFYNSHPMAVLTASSESELIAAAPFCFSHRRLGGIPLKEARLIAGAHSHLNILPVPKDREKILALFLERMLSDGVDLIYLEDLKPGWPDEAWLVDFCRERKLEMEARQIRSSPYISTEGSFDEYRQTLSRNFRKVISNRLNRIERAGGFEIKSYSDSESIEQALCDVEEISKNSWQGKAGSGLFSTDANKQFYMNLIKHAFEHQYGTLFVLQIENQPAAFEFHLFHEETEYCLKSEYAARFEEVSPGTVLYYELLKRAFESPVKIYD